MLIEAIEQINLLKKDCEKNQHQYYSSVLANIEVKLRKVYEGSDENTDIGAIDFAKWILKNGWTDFNNGEEEKEWHKADNTDDSIADFQSSSELFETYKKEVLNRI